MPHGSLTPQPVTVNATPTPLIAFSVSDGTAPALNKSMLSIVNAGGSPVTIKIREVYIRNLQQPSITGVLAEYQLKRITGHTGGTNITSFVHTMDTADTLNASVSVFKGATVSGESTFYIKNTVLSTDELTISGTGLEEMQLAVGGVKLYQQFPSMKPLTLEAGQGITIKATANSTVGEIVTFVSFTQE